MRRWRSSFWAIAAAFIVRLIDVDWDANNRHQLHKSARSKEERLWTVEDGCQKWPGTLSREAVATVLKSPPPTGLVVSLLHVTEWARKDFLLGAVCQNVPRQQRYFLEPHGMDLLLLLSGGIVEREWVVRCLALSRVSAEEEPDSRGPTTRVWNNLDGSILVTNEYRSPSGNGRVFIAEITISWPDYIRRNMTILKEPIDPQHCTDKPDYIQGTRFYTNEMLHLAILQEYDYWLKVDLDIVFDRPLPFNVLHDMRIRGALFAHTAEFEGGDDTCSRGLRDAIISFVELKTEMPDWAVQMNWSRPGRPCSAGLADFERDADLYYTNFVLGETAFWQSEPVLHFARHLTKFRPGFFKHRWTDQAFFHLALGLFIGPDFRTSVADYTDLRCFPAKECWESAYNNAACNNGGYFMHTKNFMDARALNATDRAPTSERLALPYRSKYVSGMCRGENGYLKKNAVT